MSEYAEHRIRQHQAATIAYAEWRNSLSEEDKKIADKCVPNDCTEEHGYNYQSDPAETVAVPPIYRDNLVDQLCERFDLTEGQAAGIIDWVKALREREKVSIQSQLLQAVIGGLLSSKNPKIAAASLAFAAELHTLNDIASQSEYAKSIGVTRQAISKMVGWWKRELNLRPGAYQKSTAACASMSKKQKENHWRHKPTTASSILASIRKKCHTP
jgi:hypothetical protein